MFRLRSVYPELVEWARRVFVRSLEGFGEESDRTFREKILKFPQSGKRAKTEGGLGRREVFARKGREDL